jgi:hypothetical protein
MADRHVAGFARRERERQADEIGPVRVERIGLGIEARMPVLRACATQRRAPRPR